jgi:hypothetical protein
MRTPTEHLNAIPRKRTIRWLGWGFLLSVYGCVPLTGRYYNQGLRPDARHYTKWIKPAELMTPQATYRFAGTVECYHGAAHILHPDGSRTLLSALGGGRGWCLEGGEFNPDPAYQEWRAQVMRP